MPNLAKIIERGVIGNVRAIGPGVPAMLWTSVATGKTADQHGVLSGVEADPLGGALRDVSSTCRRGKALWNIAMQAGLRTHVVNWSATHPAEPLNGSCVPPPFTKPTAMVGEPWPVAAGSVFPERIAEALAQFRVHAGELTGEELLPFLPNLSRIDQDRDNRAIVVADLLARAISVQGVATWLLEQEPCELMMMGWDAVELAGYRFLQYEPPRLPFISEDDFRLYGEVVKGMYCFHDMLLGHIVRLAGPDATIVIASPSGFRTGAERPVADGWRQNPGAWLRPYGALAMAGPGIRKDELIHGATQFDLAPTVLTLLGIAAGEDMPGRVLEQAFEIPRNPQRIPSWEHVAGDAGLHQLESEEDRAAGAAAIAGLETVGYEQPAPHPNEAVVRRNRLLNRGLVQMSVRRYTEARQSLEELAAELPEKPELRMWIAYCQQMLGDRSGCKETLAGIEAEGLTGAMASLLEAQIEGESPSGQAALLRAESLAPEVPLVCYLAAGAHLRTKNWEAAERQLRRSLELDPSFQPSHDMLAHLLAAQGRTSEAVDAALAALEIDAGSAMSHFALGLALVGDGDPERALRAFDWSRELNPQLRDAGLWAAAVRIRQRAEAAAKAEQDK